MGGCLSCNFEAAPGSLEEIEKDVRVRRKRAHRPGM